MMTLAMLTIGTGWESVGGQLLASGVLFISGHQDLGLRARIGATFWFFMALAFSISALVTALRGGLWGAPFISAAALCFESWLLRRWCVRNRAR